MKTTRMLLLLSVATTIAATILGCNEDQQLGLNDARLKDYKGLLLPHGVVETPAAHEAYVTLDGDTLYMIAKRFYGKGWRFYAIEAANKDRIKSLVLDNGLMKPGVVLFLPVAVEDTMLIRESRVR